MHLRASPWQRIFPSVVSSHFLSAFAIRAVGWDPHISVIQLASLRKDTALACTSLAFRFYLPYLVKLWASLFLERAVSPVSRTISHLHLVRSWEAELACRSGVSVQSWGKCKVGVSLRILSVYRAGGDTSLTSEMFVRNVSSCRPLLLLPAVPPSIRVFSNESTLHMRWPKYWSFSFPYHCVCPS